MIELEKNTSDAIDCKVYLMSQKEDTTLKELITEQLAKGYIHPSKSQYASFFFFITTIKDRKLQLVQDYWRINSHTICNQCPLVMQ